MAKIICTEDEYDKLSIVLMGEILTSEEYKKHLSKAEGVGNI